MERGLEGGCGGREALPEMLLLLGALSGVEAVLIIGGRGRLEMDEFCCGAC